MRGRSTTGVDHSSTFTIRRRRPSHRTSSRWRMSGTHFIDQARDIETEAEVLHESRQAYSKRVPTAVAQPVPITAPLTSRVSMVDRDANSSPLAPSSKAAVTFCAPRNTPLASYR
jgi:hypothetical protein